METEPGITRRFRLLDAIGLIAATALAILPAKDRWPEVAPVARQIQVTRLLDHGYVESLFDRQMRSGRSDSIRVQLAQMVAPAIGLRQFIMVGTTEFQPEPRDLAFWAWVHASPGAVGFALAQDVYCLVFPFLFLWSACLAVLRLFRPRPAWYHLLRQPGWWACSSSILASVVGIVAETRFDIPVPSVIAPVFVVIAWVVLVASGKVKAERSWIDQAGRVLGVSWVGTIPLYLTGFVFS